MTFTTSLKEEISKNDTSILEARFELLGFIMSSGKFDDTLTLTLENASVTRKLYKDIKKIFGLNPTITIRIQKRFRIKQIYILIIDNKKSVLDEVSSFNIEMLETDEEKASFLRGAFLGIGNISNPQTSGYHLEYICNNLKFANIIKELLESFNFNAKIITRGYKQIVYLKASENISDLLKLFKATQAMFFFEDIRIYRDHKNMVNRLNNCEISNQTKTLQTGIKQLEEIKYLKEHDLIDLLDEKTKIIIDARLKYPESSFNELSEIISLEYNYKIGKSGINHHFIKISNLVNNHKVNNENK